jgi:Tol biopolymer transport system component
MNWKLAERLVSRSLLAFLALCVSLALTATGSATVPGKNGRIVFAATTGRFTQLFTVEPDGSGLKRITHFDDSDALNPNWSPDGKRIVFERDFPYGHAGVYTVETNGADVRSLTPSMKKGLYEGAPAYSPDGRRIVFVRQVCSTQNCDAPRDLHNALWTKRADGTGPRLLLPRVSKRGRFVDHPRFSPDGTRVVYVLGIGNDQAAVFVANARGGNEKRLTRYRMGVDDRVDWSPDGRLILFSDNFQHVDIYTVRPTGASLRRIYRATDGNYSADSWSPDGKQILLLINARSTRGLSVMNADGTGLKHGDITHGVNVRDEGGSWGTRS